jgi:peptidoglycan/xylan/chitin deacetylase (PgdA/CDA1 family)
VSADDVLVLSYHAVSVDWPAPLSVTPDRFERQLRLLAARGYRGVTFTEATSAPAGRSVAVTFDDGYRSVLRLAFPILQRVGFPASVFVPTAFVGVERAMSWPGIDRWIGGPHEHELVPLSWAELEELAAAGWEVGSHTVAHPYLTHLAPHELAHELSESKRACEEALGRGCMSLAYPYGDYDDAVVRAVAAAGYSAACTVPRVLEPPRPLAWPRVGVYHDDGDATFRAKVSPRLRRLRATRAWAAVDPPRRALKRAIRRS